MKQNHQKEQHELGHHLVHEENHKKTRFGGAQKNHKKSTIWYTKKTQKKHDLVHEENQKKTRFGARRKPQKSTIRCTKKTRNFLVLHLKHV
jgi:hypothetical protein